MFQVKAVKTLSGIASVSLVSELSATRSLNDYQALYQTFLPPDQLQRCPAGQVELDGVRMLALCLDL